MASLTATTCYHCGQPCADKLIAQDGHVFCCTGCRAVYGILAQAQLCNYYELQQAPGRPAASHQRFAWLDQPELLSRVADLVTPARVSLNMQVPAMHCASCIWVLEHLDRLLPGIIDSRVSFVEKQINVAFNPQLVSASQVASTLASIGYEPVVAGAPDQEAAAHKRQMRGIVARIGVTGFCAGNIMLMAFPEYLGIDADVTPALREIFAWLNLALSLPVVLFGASEYFMGAVTALRTRRMSLDVPLALGIATLFLRSVYETLTQTGPGFYDALAGLVLFLLAGRWVQRRTFGSLRFDTRLQQYFPIAACQINEDGAEKYVPLDQLVPGDRLRIRNQELIPADGLLQSAAALIDYSFVTGEAQPVPVNQGERVFAGGRLQTGFAEVVVERALDSGRFSRLWNHQAFRKQGRQRFALRLEGVFSKYFTAFTIALALGAGGSWLALGQVDNAWGAFTAVLIVACPCALSLAMPFAMQAAMHSLAQLGVFAKNAQAMTELAGINHLVFDKTGTLTHAGAGSFSYHGTRVSDMEALVASVARHSSHPLSRALAEGLPRPQQWAAVSHLDELPGQGLRAVARGRHIRLGSADFCGAPAMVANATQVMPEAAAEANGSRVYVSIDGLPMGYYELQPQWRPGLAEMAAGLKKMGLGISILSGDNAAQAPVLRELFGSDTELHFHAQPEEKLAAVEALERAGKTVAMAGDGMNDAGAFAAASLGLAIKDDFGSFSPASDVIIEGRRLPQLHLVLAYARRAYNNVAFSFLISLVFNAIALWFAVTAQLSAPIAALLMPLGSITVVLTATGLTWLAGQRLVKTVNQHAQTLAASAPVTEEEKPAPAAETIQ